jgi:hypothetical protein
VDEAGNVLATRDEILNGQEAFLTGLLVVTFAAAAVALVRDWRSALASTRSPTGPEK